MADGGGWEARGLCRQMPETEAARLFFSDSGAIQATAKQVCAGCPVVAECLEFARQFEMPGVFGGTSKKQRQAMRAARNKEAAAA